MAELRRAHERTPARPRPGAGAVAACVLAAASPSLAASRVALAQTDPSPGYATQPFTPRSFTMPQGEGCVGEIARWRAVQDNDYAGGNIGLRIYRQIQDDIARADAACRAGRDKEARGMIHASKRRHGYPD